MRGGIFCPPSKQGRTNRPPGPRGPRVSDAAGGTTRRADPPGGVGGRAGRHAGPARPPPSRSRISRRRPAAPSGTPNPTGCSDPSRAYARPGLGQVAPTRSEQYSFVEGGVKVRNDSVPGRRSLDWETSPAVRPGGRAVMTGDPRRHSTRFISYHAVRHEPRRFQRWPGPGIAGAQNRCRLLGKEGA